MTSYSDILHFERETIDPSQFQIEDVMGDNACFYRALANVIFYLCQSTDVRELSSLKGYGTWKPIHAVYGHEQWGVDGDQQLALAKLLHTQIFTWIMKHPKAPISECGMNLDMLIKTVHGLTIPEYTKVYSQFPNHSQKIPHNSNWAGLPEQVAFTRIFKVPLYIVTAVSFSSKSHRIYSGRIGTNNKPFKNVRLQLLQKIGTEFDTGEHNRPGIQPVYLLWKKCYQQGHYMALYPRL